MGINNSEDTLNVITLIPFYEFRGVENPEDEFVFVKLNGEKVQSFLFTSMNGLDIALRDAKKSFSNDKLLSSQLNPKVPTLFINAGAVKPGEELKIEYELKPRGPIKVNRKRQ